MRTPSIVCFLLTALGAIAPGPLWAGNAAPPSKGSGDSIGSKIQQQTDVTLGAPKMTDVQLHPSQPQVPDLRNRADEQHGPIYKAPTDKFVGYFTPFHTDRAALSPDGKYLAYTVREESSVSVVIVAIDHPEKATAKITVATDDTSTPMLSENQQEKTPAAVRWMRWTTPTRLIVDTNGAFAVGQGSTWITHVGAVFGMDADGRNARLLATPRDVKEQLPDEATQVPEDLRGTAPTIWTVDQPIPNSSSPSEEDDPAPVVAMPDKIVNSVAQDIRVFDVDPKDTSKVLLMVTGNSRASGARRVSFVSLQTESGKLVDVTDDIVPGLSSGLTDRTGHVRITLPVTLLAPFPHQYLYLGATGMGRPKPLDGATGYADGTGFSVSPENFFGHRAIPLGFDEDANILYYAANTGRDTYGVYSIDLSSGKRGAIQFENATYDLAPPIDAFDTGKTLVIDRFQHRLAGIRFSATLNTTAWIYPSFQAVQKTIERSLPGHSVEILEWDHTGNRFLVLASAPGDAGAFYVFERSTERLEEFVRRAPWIDAGQSHKTFALAMKTVGDLPMTGLMTLPNQPRITPMPVIIVCPDMPWERVPTTFANRVQALADMGFVVVQINGRGAWGFGVKHRAALAAGYDRVQVEDIMAAVDYVTHNFKVDPKRIALLGEQHGGFVALRALQEHPDRFRCAIAINAPVDLAGWLEEQRWTEGAAGPALTRGALGDSARIKEAPLVKQVEAIKDPVFLLNYGGPDGAPRTATYLAAKNFVHAVRARAPESEFADLSMDYMRGFPQAKSDAYQQIESFLNVTVYDFKVKVGDAKVQSDTPRHRDGR